MQSWAVGSRLENNNRSSSEYGWDAKKAGNGLAAMRAEAAPGSAMWPSGSNDAATTFLLRRQVRHICMPHPSTHPSICLFAF